MKRVSDPAESDKSKIINLSEYNGSTIYPLEFSNNRMDTDLIFGSELFCDTKRQTDQRFHQILNITST